MLLIVMFPLLLVSVIVRIYLLDSVVRVVKRADRTLFPEGDVNLYLCKLRTL